MTEEKILPTIEEWFEANKEDDGMLQCELSDTVPLHYKMEDFIRNCFSHFTTKTDVLTSGVSDWKPLKVKVKIKVTLFRGRNNDLKYSSEIIDVSEDES